jgi:hypothetical protein
MSLPELLSKARQEFSELNPPATDDDLRTLEKHAGRLPGDVLTLYKDHNGSNYVRSIRAGRFVARLMPTDEVIKTGVALQRLGQRVPTVEQVVWLWADDNSNYCGVFSTGPLTNWLTVFDHEEQMLTPAFRSVESFIGRILNEVHKSETDSHACDIPSIEREIPELHPDEATETQDQNLSVRFREEYQGTTEKWKRRLYAYCSICLTPYDNSEDVTWFFRDKDMWIPSAAVRLLEVRNWKSAVEQLETLALDGHPNGDSASIRALARMDTDESRQAIARLRRSLTGQKLKVLEMWTSGRIQAQPARW